MARAMWKGAISFGLVNIPVALYPAVREDEIDFDWLDKRTMDPVGYKRVNKRTGKEIEKDNIIRGVEQAKGQYVVLSDDEIKAAYPRTTGTIDIEAFVDAADIPFVYLEHPYYLAPAGKGAEKVYALLRDALMEAKKVGVARFVLHNKAHLAALIPAGPVLMLNTLRWATEIRPLKDIDVPGKSSSVKPAEKKMAAQLIEQLSDKWNPERFKDTFRDAIMALVEKKAKAGETAAIEPMEEGADTGKSNVIDLTELLKKSLAARGETKKASAKKRAKASSGRSTTAAKGRKRKAA